jgi:hypothetical protein
MVMPKLKATLRYKKLKKKWKQKLSSEEYKKKVRKIKHKAIKEQKRTGEQERLKSGEMIKITILSVQHSGVKFTRELLKLNFNQDSFPDKQHIQAKSRIRTYKKILLIRDGRDVMASTYAGEMQRVERDPTFKEKKMWEGMTFSEYLRFKYRKIIGEKEKVTPVEFWVRYNMDWERKGIAGRIQYERLISEQKRMLNVLGRFLNKKPKHKYIDTTNIVGIPTTWHGYHPAKSNWEKFFNKEDLEYFDSIAGDLMRKYLYYE